MEINNSILPEEILINILSRLPAASVLRCSLVRKAWQNLIVYNREFARMHLLRGLESHHGASGKVNFLLLINLGYDPQKGYKLYYTLDDDNNSKVRLRELHWNPNNPYNNKNYYVVGSCNGLICMAYDAGSDDSYEAYEQPIYISNPTTREWLTIPSLIINKSCDCSMYNNGSKEHASDCISVVYGYGYLPSTNEYKVVRIYYCHQEEPFVGRVHVYTLGDGTGWRDKGKITYSLLYNPTSSESPSILANGALHWLDEEGKNIVAFDLADEEFLLLPSPPCFLLDEEEEEENAFKIKEIKVLGEQLCVVCLRKDNSTVGVWVFKNKKKKNGNYKDINDRREYQFWSWIKEFHIEKANLKAKHLMHPSFILTKQGDVLYYNRKKLFCHELKTATSKEFVNMKKCLHDPLHHLEAIIPHLNSFVSLKALGEEDSKIRSKKKKKKTQSFVSLKALGEEDSKIRSKKMKKTQK